MGEARRIAVGFEINRKGAVDHPGLHMLHPQARLVDRICRVTKRRGKLLDRSIALREVGVDKFLRRDHAFVPQRRPKQAEGVEHADAAGRAENLRRSAHVARFINDSGDICCASFVAPNEDSREHARSVIGRDNCYIIYLNPPMEVCIQRDPSGLYAAAEGSGSADIPGLSFPYESPSLTHLELDTAELSLEDCLDRVIRLMESEAII